MEDVSPRKRGWQAIGLRAVPVVVAVSLVAMLTTGVFRSGAEADEQGKTVRIAADAPAAGPPGLAGGATGGGSGRSLAYERNRPELFIEGTIGPSGEADGEDTISTTSTTEDSTDKTTEDSDATDTSQTTGPATTRRSFGIVAAEAAPGTTSATATSTAADATSPTTARRTTTAPTAGRSTTGQATTRPTPAPTTRPTTAPTTRQTTPPTTAAATTAAPTTAAPATAGNSCSTNAEFERVFRDDFSGSSVSGSWAQFNSNGNANFGLRRSSANTVANGKLSITARMENGTLVSGGMSHRFDQKYGKWVVKVRTDNDPSQAVSGVVLTWPQSGVHPRDGENNIYETLVQKPNRNPFFTFIHKPYGSKSDQEYKEHHADGSQFQVMTMEWTPSRITIVREGPGGSSYRDVWTVNETSADLIPDVAHHLAIQLDAWKHSIANPVKLEVDYVEVYKYCG